MKKQRPDPARLADEHWEYTKAVAEFFYKRAFVHGYKHGVEDEKENKKK